MKNIWTYSTQENGLGSNDVYDTVLGKAPLVYAATAKGISGTGDSGKTWGPGTALGLDFGTDICANRRSGTILFTGADDSGLGVLPSGQTEPYYIHQKDGIYSDAISSVQIDESVISDHPIGAAYLSHYSGGLSGGLPADRTISRYSVKTGTWQVLQPEAFAGVIDAIIRIRLFNGSIYVCGYGALAISDDGERWKVISDFNVAPRPINPFVSGQYYQVHDFHVNAKGEWYVLLTFKIYESAVSHVLKSNDGGETWASILYSDRVRAGFLWMETAGDDLFVIGDAALRVLNGKNLSVRFFDEQNGLNAHPDDVDLGPGSSPSMRAMSTFLPIPAWQSRRSRPSQRIRPCGITRQCRMV
jgi:hypothetical protein